MAAFVTLVALGSTVLLLSTSITLAQGGLYVASKMMKPDLGKLSLLKGAKRMFGPQAWWELAKMLIKTLLVTGLVYQTVSTLIPMIGGLVPLTAAISVGSDHAFSMLRNVALAGVAMGALDYLMARRRITKATNMTKQEVKDEHKQAEGDPMLKGQIRSRQLANARNRMIADVMEWSRTSRSPAPSTAPPRSGWRSPPSSSPRWRTCSRSSSAAVSVGRTPAPTAPRAARPPCRTCRTPGHVAAGPPRPARRPGRTPQVPCPPVDRTPDARRASLQPGRLVE